MIETDERSRVGLPGHARQRFVLQEKYDGCILLLPAVVITEALLEFDRSSELQDLLARAATSASVRKSRGRPG